MNMDSIVTVLQAVLAVLVLSSILIGLLSLRNELLRSRRRRTAFLAGAGGRPVVGEQGTDAWFTTADSDH